MNERKILLPLWRPKDVYKENWHFWMCSATFDQILAILFLKIKHENVCATRREISLNKISFLYLIFKNSLIFTLSRKYKKLRWFTSRSMCQSWWISCFWNLRNCIQIFLLEFVSGGLKAKLKQSLWRSWGFQEVEAPRFRDNWHMKVVRLSPYAPAAFTPRK